MPINGTENTDELVGTQNDDQIYGFGGDDYIEAGDGADYVSGDGGNDVINGGAGIDDLFGGAGDDVIYSGQGAGAGGLQAFDNLSGGSGNDTLVLTPDYSTTNYFTVDGGAGIDTLVIEGLERVTVSLGYHDLAESQVIGANSILYMTGIENVTGTFGNDVLYGDDNANIIDGGSGSDFMAGGYGNDTYYVDDASDTIVEQGGIDTVYTAGFYTDGGLPNYTLADGIENAALIHDAYAILYGNELNNILTAPGGYAYGMGGNDLLYGGDWSNRLDGGSGDDRMWGGAGDDTYIVDSSADRAIEFADEGFDTVFASVNFALGANVERLELIGTALIGRGNGLNNGLVANDLGNSLLGYAGDDSLFGGSGNDWLNGGTGADYMKGGQSDDVYFVDNPGDIVSEYVGEGTDTVYSTVSFDAQYRPLEKLILTGAADVDLTGNELDNVMMGNAGSNILNGWQGADRLFGQGGADTLYGGLGNDWIQGGQGTDHLYGGEGADQFVFDDGEFGGRARGNGDVIHDFSHAEGDRIRLSLADANTNTVEDDAFTFIGTNAFSGHAGELRISTYLSDLIVTGDVNGDGVADFLIIVSNTSSLLASDFIF